MVKAKKHLGQHFLIDKNIAEKISRSLLNPENYPVLEIGPGTGVLTDYLIQKFDKLNLIEIDSESVNYIREKYPEAKFKLYEADFLKTDLSSIFSNQFCIIGNFPYNISSQIFFKMLEHKSQIPELCGMVQKEMAERIFSKHGNKNYGILSVLIQLFYKVEYLFTVNEKVFRPPPAVKSAVIRFTRYRDSVQGIDEARLFLIVKTAFNQRRKTLRNSLKPIIQDGDVYNGKYSTMRPEQLSPELFLELYEDIHQKVKRKL